MTKKVIVTGGAGFIGSNMVIHQIAAGNEVIAIDSMKMGHLENLRAVENNPKFKLIKADLCHFDAIDKTLGWADEIYHLAAYVGQKLVLSKPIDTLWNNILSLQTILDSLGRIGYKGRLLIASTSELYFNSEENPDGTVSENLMMVFPPGKCLQETYPVSKLVNEVMSLAYAHEKKVDCTIARLFNTIGVNQSPAYGMVVPNFIRQALAKEPLTIFGDGNQTRSFSDVRDSVRALDLLLKNPKSNGQIVNVGDDRECSINRLADLVIEMTGSTGGKKYLSYQEAYGLADFNDVRRRRPNLTKLRELTGFKPSYDLKATLESILERQVAGK